MRIDNTFRSLVQNAAESAAPSSADQETSAQASSGGNQNADTIEADANSYSTIRHEIAGALGVQDNAPVVDQTYAQLVTEQRENQEAARVAANEAVINDAITYGHREETALPLGITEFKEFVPNASGELKDFAVRWGTDTLEKGFFSDDIIRRTKYSINGQMLGTVTSVIKGDVETITDVDPAFPGAIDLKPGDTRTVPDPSKSLAGAKPSTWDPKPDGSYGTTTGSSSSSPSNDTQSSSGGPAASGGVDHAPINDGSNTTSGSSGSSGDGAVSDPSEWAAWPGEASSGDSGGIYATGVDARDDGSVLITTSDGQSHEFSNFDQAAAWSKDNLSSPPPSNSDSSGDDGDDGDTHTSVEGNTTVEVEAPESEGTKINEGEDDKYIAWDENSLGVDYSLPPEQRGMEKNVDSGYASGSGSGNKTTESFSDNVGNPNSVVRNFGYFDFGWKMDQFGGVTDGSRPDMEDSSAREEPYQGPNYGVIDTTPEVDDYSTAFRDPNDNLNFAGRGGDPVNPDNPINDARPDGGPPSTDPQSHDT